MSRFANLEFGESRGPKAKGDAGEPVRDSDYFIDRADEAWLSGDFEGALRYYSRALEMNKTFFVAWFGQVRMLIELGEYTEATLWADKSLELFPEHPELFAAKAVALARDEQAADALAYSDNSISKDRVTSFVWLARAEILLKMRAKMAESCISNAVSIAANVLPIVRLEAGRILFRYRRYSPAMELLYAAARDLPKSALVWYELGRCQAAVGLPEANSTLSQSLQLRPNWEAAKSAHARLQKRRIFGSLLAWLRRLRGK